MVTPGQPGARPRGHHSCRPDRPTSAIAKTVGAAKDVRCTDSHTSQAFRHSFRATPDRGEEKCGSRGGRDEGGDSIGNTAAQEKKHVSRHELYTVKQHAIQDRVLPQHATSHVRRMWRACIYCDELFNRCCSDESSGGHLHNTFHRAPVARGVCESCISAFMYFGNQFERNGGEMGSEFDIGRGLPSTPCLEEADTIEPTAKNRGAKAKRPSFDDQSFLHCFEGMDLHKIRQGSG